MHGFDITITCQARVHKNKQLELEHKPSEFILLPILKIVTKHMTGCSIFSTVQFGQTTGFYCSCMLLLKPSVLIDNV